tara:strand:- start:185 stop:400 length:216 start_codon:yes stop_codon:yes gene_type:complete
VPHHAPTIFTLVNFTLSSNQKIPTLTLFLIYDFMHLYNSLRKGQNLKRKMKVMKMRRKNLTWKNYKKRQML